jgi:hypothetical protein
MRELKSDLTRLMDHSLAQVEKPEPIRPAHRISDYLGSELVDVLWDGKKPRCEVTFIAVGDSNSKARIWAEKFNELAPTNLPEPGEFKPDPPDQFTADFKEGRILFRLQRDSQ